MTEFVWSPGTIGDWFDPNNWQPDGPPQAGDTAIVDSGTAVIDEATISDETIRLGDATLQLISAALEPGTGGLLQMFVVGGTPADPAGATILSRGSSSFTGSLTVEAFAGSLTIDAESDGSTANFTIGQDSLALVTQDSLLSFVGEDITNDGNIHIEGVARIGTGVRFGGAGDIELDQGGRLFIDGSISDGQRIVLIDGKEQLNIAHIDQFRAHIALTVYGGDRIELEDVVARSKSFKDGVLTLYSRPHHQGHAVATLDMDLVNPASLAPLPPDEQTLGADDFTLARTGHGGTLITYTPRSPVLLEASLPVAVIAQADSTVSLDTIFAQSFGTQGAPKFYGIELVPATPLESPESYWGQPNVNGMDAVKPAWIVNGQEIDKPTPISSTDSVELRVGNNIGFPPQIKVRVTPDSERAEFVSYYVWTVDPSVAQLVQGSGYSAGHPVPQNILDSAAAYQSVYGQVFNAELCNWIADDVAAAAGATMPLPNQMLDSSLNVNGGFWRIAYRSSDYTDPIADWNELVQPGDVVRLQWQTTGAGHTTTVLSVAQDGSLEVYDNIDIINGEHHIGAHDNVNYWEHTDPAGITIYRLDPLQQYLIEGTNLGEFIQGSVYNDLIKAAGGKDKVEGSVGDDTLLGGKGGDTINAGDGNDAIIGGLQRDIISGGDGFDRFVYTSINQSLAGTKTRDTIIDFTQFADHIDLSKIDANTSAPGKQSFHFIGSRPLGQAAGELDFVKHERSVVVQGDTDGDGRADFQIVVRGVEKMVAGDFDL